MKTRLLTLGARLLVASAALILTVGCASTSVTKNTVSPSGKRITIRTTAYTQTEPGGCHNAVGGRLRYCDHDSSAASDWSWMPLGTRFKMLSTGRTYIIEDYGSALVGRKTVDLYMPTRRLMRNWGVRNVDIEILEWGSPRRSLEVLGDRRKKEHVRRMVVALLDQSRGMPSSFNRIEVR